jgi:hypothetical protein
MQIIAYVKELIVPQFWEEIGREIAKVQMNIFSIALNWIEENVHCDAMFSMVVVT